MVPCSSKKIISSKFAFTTLVSVIASLSLSVAVTLAQDPASADDEGEVAQAGPMEVIIITAERTEQSILDAPLSVTAFDSRMMEELQITSNKDLEVRTPGLQFGLDSPATIRGIGGLLSRNGGDLSVATYSNDLYFDEPYGVVGSLYDIERVEILRGPQGTLYGRNSVAGAINYISKRPQQEFDIGVLTELGNNEAIRLGSYVTGPLMDGVSFRLTGEWRDSSGFQQNISGPDASTREDWSISPQLRLQRGSWDINLRYAHFEEDARGDLVVPIRIPDPSNEFHLNPVDGSPTENRNQYFGFPHTTPIATRGGGVENRLDLNNVGRDLVERTAINLHVDYEINDIFGVTYIYGDSELNFCMCDSDMDESSIQGAPGNPYVSEYSGMPFTNGYINPYFTRDIITHELRLAIDTDRFSGIVGYYNFDEDLINDFQLFNLADEGAMTALTDIEVFGMPGEMFLPMMLGGEFPLYLMPGFYLTPNAGDGLFYRDFTSRTYKSQAVFAQGRFQLTDQLGIVAGVRYTDDDKATNEAFQKISTSDPVGFFEGELFYPITLNIEEGPASYESDKVTWTLTAEYTTDNDNLIYGRIATGFRSGGITQDVPPPYDFFEDEELTSFELGFKGMINERAQVLATAFYYDFQDYQQIIQVLDFLPNGRPFDRTVIDNIPDTTIIGLELEGTLAITDDLTLRGFYAYQKSELGDLITTENRDPNSTFREEAYTNPLTGEQEMAILAEQFNFSGNELPNTPQHKFSLTADYVIGMNSGDLVWTGSYSYTGERYSRISNVPITEIDSYGRLDTSLTYRPYNANWRVSFFVENLTDEVGIMELQNMSFADGFGAGATLMDPRFYGIVFRWDLGGGAN